MHPNTPRPRAQRRVDGRSRGKGVGQPSYAARRLSDGLERAVIARLRGLRAAPLRAEPDRTGGDRFSRDQVVPVEPTVGAEAARLEPNRAAADRPSL
jgi:hypothetical protein